jgi:antitoxin (DNA-binding transcriptional repressor) of toxin-antitoxin stability system
MFQVLERVAEGETVEITWKGSKLLLRHPQGGS